MSSMRQIGTLLDPQRRSSPWVRCGECAQPTHMHAENDHRLMQALLVAMECRGSWKNWAESKTSPLLVCRTSQREVL